jgi:putative addiction module killer protein
MRYNKTMKYILKQTTDFSNWLENLKDTKVQARITARVDAIGNGNFGDWKHIETGLCEMRIDYGPGYRVYYGQVGQLIILIVGGGIKRTQKKDIAKFHALWAEIKGGGYDQEKD